MALPNSQGLFFELAEDKQVLLEKHNRDGAIALWEADLLKRRLLEKHNETFWIEADSVRDKTGQEGFKLKSITHTRAPAKSQLMPLLEEGVITMDHLIKRSGKTGQVSEKGPLFKIAPENLQLLFPEPIHYSL